MDREWWAQLQCGTRWEAFGLVRSLALRGSKPPSCSQLEIQSHAFQMQYCWKDVFIFLGPNYSNNDLSQAAPS